VWKCTNWQCQLVHDVRINHDGTCVDGVKRALRFALPDLRNVSESVARDVDEGIRAANAGCPRAAAVMLRRALEQACNEAGATTGKLIHKIEKLKSMGVISGVFAATAHAIRAFGNDYGAHPDDDLLDDVPDDELEAAIKLTAAVVGGMAKMKNTIADEDP
jgi:hypothetical protein